MLGIILDYEANIESDVKLKRICGFLVANIQSKVSFLIYSYIESPCLKFDIVQMAIIGKNKVKCFVKSKSFVTET